MMSHWIIAPVVLPAIMGAFALLVLRNSLPVARTLSTAATAALLAIALYLLWGASHEGPEAYLLGNWPAPFGITLVLDRLSALMVTLTAFRVLLPVGIFTGLLGAPWLIWLLWCDTPERRLM